MPFIYRELQREKKKITNMESLKYGNNTNHKPIRKKETRVASRRLSLSMYESVMDIHNMIYNNIDICIKAKKKEKEKEE